jgi:hypothetical protein
MARIFGGTGLFSQELIAQRDVCGVKDDERPESELQYSFSRGLDWKDARGNRSQTPLHGTLSPSTNGKVERFWRTFNDDLIEGIAFESWEESKKELEQYIDHDNTQRPHQALEGKTPPWISQLLSMNYLTYTAMTA